MRPPQRKPGPVKTCQPSFPSGGDNGAEKKQDSAQCIEYESIRGVLEDNQAANEDWHIGDAENQNENGKHLHLDYPGQVVAFRTVIGMDRGYAIGLTIQLLYPLYPC
jgi:hypothetical protein